MNEDYFVSPDVFFFKKALKNVALLFLLPVAR